MKKLYSFFLFCMITLSVEAQTPQFFKGSGTGSNSYPFSSTAGLKTQHLYLPGDLPGATAGTITRIYFRSVTANTSASFTNFYFKLGQSTATQFPSAGTAFFTGLTTVVYGATYTVYSAATASSWFYVDLQTPFVFDPLQSLVLEVVWDTKTAGGFNVHTTTSAGAPNNKRLVATTPGAATGSASSNWMDFGFDLGTPLNVKLLDFSCIRIPQGVQVSWTATEGGKMKDYQIERSNDGQSFTTVGTTEAKNLAQENTAYSFVDAGTNTAKDLYYRLKYTETNGNSAYSRIARLAAEAPKDVVVRAVPNPFLHEVHLSVPGTAAEHCNVHVSDMMGKTVYRSVFSLTDGNDLIKLPLDGKLENGIYFLSVELNDKVYTSRLYKQ